MSSARRSTLLIIAASNSTLLEKNSVLCRDEDTGSLIFFKSWDPKSVFVWLSREVCLNSHEPCTSTEKL